MVVKVVKVDMEVEALKLRVGSYFRGGGVAPPKFGDIL